jgi:heme A synthase
MKRSLFFLILLASLSTIAGVLLSKISWIGKVGIRFLYHEYKFLRVWWQGAGLVFCVLLLLFIVQGVLYRVLRPVAQIIAQIVCIAAAIAGFMVTYDDFRHNIAHRWLGERFHLGAYLFWLGWVLVSLFYITAKRRIRDINKTDALTQQTL